MLSIEECQRILNESSPPGVAYTRQEAARLRTVLYALARLNLKLDSDAYHEKPSSDASSQPRPAPGLTLHTGINGRAGSP